jgi:adenylate kinase
MVAPVQGPRLVILGRQGSGKGTQGMQLAAHLGIRHLSTGAMLREAVAHRSPLGRRVQRYLHQGRLVPDDLMVGLVDAAVRDPEVDRAGFLLDGFPRTKAQAVKLLALLEPRGLDAALLLDVPRSEVERRLLARRVCPQCEAPAVALHGELTVACTSCGGVAVRRADDNPEAIARRLEAYEAQATPLEKLFAERGLLVTVDAFGPPADVFERLQRAVQPILWGEGAAVG